ncbi:hypothetical protein HJG60_009013 [Phyllostomus discolor]|uniref:Uncharacterized protein n=1 Tax=Phyllostomus discolor TaxID=89673 RepID=A0A833YJ94_9CHIR|nr:hypothetical protein HJG60_009013 [Phyllostomus discolor]
MWKPLSSLGELHPDPSDLHIWQTAPSPAFVFSYFHDLGVQVANSVFPQTQIPPFSESRRPGSLSPTPQDPRSLKPLLSRLKSLPLFSQEPWCSCLVSFASLIHNFLSQIWTPLSSKHNHVLHTYRPFSEEISCSSLGLYISPRLYLFLFIPYALCPPHNHLSFWL